MLPLQREAQRHLGLGILPGQQITHGRVRIVDLALNHAAKLPFLSPIYLDSIFGTICGGLFPKMYGGQICKLRKVFRLKKSRFHQGIAKKKAENISNGLCRPTGCYLLQTCHVWMDLRLFVGRVGHLLQKVGTKHFAMLHQGI